MPVQRAPLPPLPRPLVGRGGSEALTRDGTDGASRRAGGSHGDPRAAIGRRDQDRRSGGDVGAALLIAGYERQLQT